MSSVLRRYSSVTCLTWALIACTDEAERVLRGPGEACAAAELCVSGFACVEGMCSPACFVDDDCLSEERCKGGVCVAAPPASSGYAQWSDWTSCSTACGSGTQSRLRSCLVGGMPTDCAACGGECSESQACVETAQCTYSYGAWGWLGACSVACGTGQASRERPCVRSDGEEVACEACGGECVETQACGSTNCAYTYGPWGALTACSGVCGSATQTRTRSCLDVSSGAPVNCALCGGSCVETLPCLRETCVSYTYGNYGPYSDCTADCGGGTQERTRPCLRNDGHPVECALCGGDCVESTACNVDPCPPPNCPHDASEQRGFDYTQFTCDCRALSTLSGTVYGTNTYRDDSKLCRAALHAGVITVGGGLVTYEMRPTQSSYHGSYRNGVNSQSASGGGYRTAFVFP